MIYKSYFLKIFIFICIVVWNISNFSYAKIGQLYTNKALVKTHTDKNGNTYRIYKKPEITVITPKRFSMHFFEQWMKLSTFVDSYNCSAWLNGTYFWYNSNGSFFPAWVWYQYGKYLKEPYQPAKDKNLQVLFSWNTMTVDMIENDLFDFKTIQWEKNRRLANAWPRLVRNGEINSDIVRQKSHWQRETTRVGIVKNPNGEIHFIVATQPISLPQFIVFSYWVGIGTWTFNFVNLDGWSSTSLVTPYISYQSKKRLPSFICIQ
jgi:hypothetical protein